MGRPQQQDDPNVKPPAPTSHAAQAPPLYPQEEAPHQYPPAAAPYAAAPRSPCPFPPPQQDPLYQQQPHPHPSPQLGQAHFQPTPFPPEQPAAKPHIPPSPPPQPFPQQPPVTGFIVCPKPPPRHGQWTTGLFDCFEGPNSSLVTLFLPCVTFGQVAEILDNGQTTCATSATMYAAILSVSALPWILSCTYRTKLRAKYGLLESPAPDWLVHCLFEPCAICQEYRELRNRGFDPSIALIWWDDGCKMVCQYDDANATATNGHGSPCESNHESLSLCNTSHRRA
ncbi:cell number regulator 10-like [Nymphaea colorata]|nr:cell number regulator 10-like [Nymphaea colorata]